MRLKCNETRICGWKIAGLLGYESPLLQGHGQLVFIVVNIQLLLFPSRPVSRGLVIKDPACNQLMESNDIIDVLKNQNDGIHRKISLKQ
ncbi:hypothetical protein NPIL_86091 [Nephila pilipes]|uniref:Uncharacterized protein n=1 Tax=Nephila pilipes TaxID=299642 RepID=A0A8X6Q2B5_NEPPI|nr:hypothetical protein NPIL_186831 [Nephila pilipes]GFU59260.1 hypothetical protein NPIL_86091 [Nephila pilipes]